MNRKINFLIGLSIYSFPLLLFLTGCGAVHSDPFAKFTASLQEVDSGADEALRYAEIADRQRLIQEAADASQNAEGFDAVQNLLISVDDRDPFTWKMDGTEELMVSLQFRWGINTLNSTIISYSEFLTALAGSGMVSETDFYGMAQELNMKIKSAAAALRLENSNEIEGIVSTGASEEARTHISHKKNEKLQKILEENQPLIVDISDRLQGAIQTAAEHLRSDYDENSIKLARDLRPDLTVSLETRKRNVAKLLDLNDEFLTRLRILETLKETYRLLPKAHAELIVAVKKPACDLTAIDELYENGKRMNALYKKLRDNENR